MTDKIEDNVVYVGSKEPSVYAFTIKTIFEKDIKEVKVMSRGKSILTAISVVEFMKRSKQLEVKEIKTSSSEYTPKGEDRKIFVSSIEITVTKK